MGMVILHQTILKHLNGRKRRIRIVAKGWAERCLNSYMPLMGCLNGHGHVASKRFLINLDGRSGASESWLRVGLKDAAT